MSLPGALRPLEDPSEAAAEQEAELLGEEDPGDLGEGALGLAAQVQQRGPQESDAEAEAEEDAPVGEGGLQVPPEPNRHPLVPPHPGRRRGGRPRRWGGHGDGAPAPPGPAPAAAPAAPAPPPPRSSFAGCDSASGTGNRRRLPGPGRSGAPSIPRSSPPPRFIPRSRPGGPPAPPEAAAVRRIPPGDRKEPDTPPPASIPPGFASSGQKWGSPRPRWVVRAPNDGHSSEPDATESAAERGNPEIPFLCCR